MSLNIPSSPSSLSSPSFEVPDSANGGAGYQYTMLEMEGGTCVRNMPRTRHASFSALVVVIEKAAAWRTLIEQML
jgi:hypothetical protein